MQLCQSKRPVQVEALVNKGCDAQAIQCDVTDFKQQEEVFERHMQQYGRLDIVILNAGIGDVGKIAFALNGIGGMWNVRL